MPGQLARNISEDGKSLRTATFSVSSEEVVHTKGTSAGRALEACRKVRKSHLGWSLSWTPCLKLQAVLTQSSSAGSLRARPQSIGVRRLSSAEHGCCSASELRSCLQSAHLSCKSLTVTLLRNSKPRSGRSSLLSRTSFSMLAQWFLLSKRWQQRNWQDQ